MVVRVGDGDDVVVDRERGVIMVVLEFCSIFPFCGSSKGVGGVVFLCSGLSILVVEGSGRTLVVVDGNLVDAEVFVDFTKVVITVTGDNEVLRTLILGVDDERFDRGCSIGIEELSVTVVVDTIKFGFLEVVTIVAEEPGVFNIFEGDVSVVVLNTVDTVVVGSLVTEDTAVMDDVTPDIVTDDAVTADIVTDEAVTTDIVTDEAVTTDIVTDDAVILVMCS